MCPMALHTVTACPKIKHLLQLTVIWLVTDLSKGPTQTRTITRRPQPSKAGASDSRSLPDPADPPKQQASTHTPTNTHRQDLHALGHLRPLLIRFE